MNIIYFLIGCSVLLATGVFDRPFFGRSAAGKTTTLYTPSVRILLDDEEPEPGEKVTAITF
jgi:nitrogen fixation-related uncharacterized protein